MFDAVVDVESVQALVEVALKRIDDAVGMGIAQVRMCECTECLEITSQDGVIAFVFECTNQIFNFIMVLHARPLLYGGALSEYLECPALRCRRITVVLRSTLTIKPIFTILDIKPLEWNSLFHG
ncbi:hypothetical protein D3C85_1327150 [compost metagenome]